MNNRIIGINFLLMMFMIFEGFMIFQLWSSEASLPKDETKGSVNPEKFEAVSLFQVKTIPLSAYDEIIRDNLFASDRKEFVPKPIEPEPKPELKLEPKPEPVKLDTSKITLFGVILMDEQKKALVSDVDKTGKGASLWVKKGDTIDGFMVESIEKDRMIVTQKGNNFVIFLYDEKKPKQRETINREPAQKIISSEPKAIPPQPGKVVTPPVSTEKEDGEHETITTPFGDFKRKKQ